MNSFEDSILRVLKGDSVVGAAFLVSERLVATCAHVVEAAGSKAGRKISLRLSNDKDIEAIVDTEFLSDANAEDISILRLNESLENIQPIILGSSSGTKGHNFSTFGYPKPRQELVGGGEIVGQAIINGIKVLQLRSSEVTPGFSGAPVFDETTKRVVGMVVAITPPDEYQRLGTTAFAIPSETIREICPDLQVSDICPYRSLDVFNEEDAPFFFGRERVVPKIVESLKREPRFLAVLGPSGSGKSSVVRAGLIPALKQGKVPGSDKWGVITVRPTSQPFEQLDNAGLSKSEDGLENAVRAWLEYHPKKTRLVFVIDQFEELLVSSPEDIRQKFIKELTYLLDTPVAITVVLTLRDDFYSRFLKDATTLTTWLERGLVNIPTALDEDELRSIVAEPARAVGLAIEEGLLDVIIDDAIETDRTKGKARSTILPLLEFALTQLWEKRQDGQLTHESYHVLGGVTGGLTQWADSTYYSLNLSDRLTAQQFLIELVHLGDASQNLPDSRRTVFLDELHLANKQHADTTRIVRMLADARLIVTGRNAEGEYAELIHDAIIQQWALLNDWLIENRQFLTWRQKLYINYRDWKAGKADVLRGLALEEAEKWLNDYGAKLNESEINFINAGILARTEHDKRLKRVELLSLIPYMLIVFAVGMYGIYLSTRLVSNSLDERLRSQLLESGRVVSDLMAQQESEHIDAALLIAYTKGLGEAVEMGDVDKIDVLARPLTFGLNIESLLIFDRNGRELLHLIMQDDRKIKNATIAEQISTFSIVEIILSENDPNSPPHRELKLDPVDGRYYYFSAIPVVIQNRVVGVSVVGTSVNTILPSLKRASLADVVFYNEDGQAVATTIGTQVSDPVFVRTISIDKNFYAEVFNLDQMVEGENFEVNRRWYRSAFGPMKISGDRIAVFAVFLPLDFIVEAGSVNRLNYTVLLFVMIIILVVISRLISRAITRSLRSSIR